jgi:hypothetical protein
LLGEHLFVLHLLTEACFAGPGEEVGFAAAGDGLARPSPTTTVTAANAAPTLAAVAAVATNQKTLAAARAAGKGPERSGMGTKRQSMAKSVTAQVLSRTRSSRRGTRAVEESLLVVLALDAIGLLRGEWRVGRSRLGEVLPDSPLKRHFVLTILADFYTLAPMESNLRRMVEMYSSG